VKTADKHNRYPAEGSFTFPAPASWLRDKGSSFIFDFMVGAAGIEPATPAV
jgi:hypothetical protein